jgi:group I intron endonuclease
MFVYLITNLINGKRYVGQTKTTLAQRWNSHVSNDSGMYLHNAIKKYGKENFSMESICEIPTLELANEFEIEYIKRYCTLFPNGYNLQPGGNNPGPPSEETRRKISEGHKGLPMHENTRIALAEAIEGNSWNKGKIPPEETRRKISEALKGRKHSLESIEKMRAAQRDAPWKYRTHSEEAKKKIGLASSERKRSEETKQRMRDAWKIRKLNDGIFESARSPDSRE